MLSTWGAASTAPGLSSSGRGTTIPIMQEQLLKPDLPPPGPSLGGVDHRMRGGETTVRSVRALLPLQRRRREEGNELADLRTALIPRPLSGNFLFPNMKEIKIGRQEGQNMFAKTPVWF